MRLQNEYVPPYNPLVGGWDTNFKPKVRGQAYDPIPIVWFTVNVMSSLVGMRIPQFKVEPKTSAPEDRVDAANVELLLKFEQQRQMMREVHLDLAKVLSLKGRAGVKVGYDGKDLWTENIDNIENLWPAFADDSFRRIRSWTYHSTISKDAAKEEWGWKDTGVASGGGFWQWAASKFQNESHGDPLGRWTRRFIGTSARGDVPNFDGLPMIDFHYRNDDGYVVNEIWIGSQQVEERVTKMRDFPYVTVNCETEPGNPFGIGDAEPVTSLQKEISQLRTMWHEAMRRNGSDTWKVFNLKGLTPTDLEGGGRFFYLGDKESQDIEALKYPIDDVGYLQALNEAWEDFRRLTGIPPEVLGGGNISAGTSGYALAVKFQSVITRLGPRSTRLQSFYQTWGRLTLQNMEIIEPDAKKVIKDNYFVNVDFENITPKDFAQQVSALATAVSAKIMSTRTAAEELGLVSEDEETYMAEFNSNPALNPQAAAAIAAIRGQQAAAAQGNPATIAGTQAAEANRASPSMAGENQWTAPRPPDRQGAPNVVSQTPPNI
jgi:hypothetical protein